MTISVLFFGALANDLKTRSSKLTLPDNATVNDALIALSDSHPGLKKHISRVATAVNLEYVGPTHILSGDDELALIPPVSGG